MQNELLDQDHLSDMERWDSKKRLAANDAIIEVNDNVKKLTKFRWMMLVPIILNLVGLASLLFQPESSTVIDGVMGIVIALVGLILLAPYILAVIFYGRNPMLWLIVALVAYVITLVLSAGVGGIIWHIGVMVALSYAIYTASEWKKNLRILEGIGYPRQKIEQARGKMTPLPRLKKKQQ